MPPDREVKPPTNGQNPLDYVLSEYKLPWPLKEKQKEVFTTLAQYNGSGCYMDVGTGKTVVSTLLALYFGLRGDISQVLVLMPPILLLQWRNWLRTFPELTVTLYKGSPKERAQMSLGNDVVLMSIDIFKRDFDRIKKELGMKDIFVIVDEASRIRRISTDNFKSVRDFLQMGKKYFTLLTGTPINTPVHCYAYLNLLVPGMYRNYSQFVLLHVDSVDQYGEARRFKNLDLLARNMKHYSITLAAEDMLDLPEVTYDPVVYPLEPKHKKLYDQLVNDELVRLDDGKVIDATTQQRLYHAVQRVLLVPAEYGGESIVPAGYDILKNMLGETVLSGSGEKLIVYCHHQPVNEAVTAFLKTIKGVHPLQAYGAFGSDKNQRSVTAFLNDPGVNVLVANPGSIGIGLNLQSVCRAMLFLELPITPNDFVQAVGRIKREGQWRPCLIRMAIAEGTIQESLGKRVVSREDVAQRVMPTKTTLREALNGR